MSNSRFKNVCCSPFNKKNHTGPKQRKSLCCVSSLTLAKSDFLKPDDVLCAQCIKKGKDFVEYI